jgi:hypothetical protein
MENPKSKKLIIFYFKSTRFDGCIGSSFPFEPEAQSNVNDRQITFMPNDIFEQHKNNHSYRFDFCEMPFADETKIYQMGFTMYINLYIKIDNKLTN